MNDAHAHSRKEIGGRKWMESLLSFFCVVWKQESKTTSWLEERWKGR